MISIASVEGVASSCTSCKARHTSSSFCFILSSWVVCGPAGRRQSTLKDYEVPGVAELVTGPM